MTAPLPDPDPQAQARSRFMLLNLIRFGGVMIALFGAAVIGKRLIEPAEIVGGLMMALGAFEVVLLPAILVRRWRTPPGA